jgi:transcriptional regulator with XRE-family HTH domain
MNQRQFLRAAKRELGLTYPALAREIGVAARTIEKWSMDSESPDHRPMPLIARRFILKLLDERKRAVLLAGDRATAETIDAIAAQVDPERLAASLRTFDALQRSSIVVQGGPPRLKPAFFRDFAEKNEWERREEVRHARRIRAQAARRR